MPMEIIFEKDGNAFVPCFVYNVVDPVMVWLEIGLSLRPCDGPIDIGEAVEGRKFWIFEDIVEKRLEGDEFCLCLGAEEQGNAGPIQGGGDSDSQPDVVGESGFLGFVWILGKD